LLDVVQSLLDGGRFGSARRLVQELTARADAIDDEARLELAQGDAKRALGVIHEAYGTGLEDASVDLLLVAALAAVVVGSFSAASPGGRT